MRSLVPGSCAVIVGASGGIGAALVATLVADPAIGCVYALSRAGVQPIAAAAKVRRLTLDLLDEHSIAAAAAAIAEPPRLVIVATGALHGGGLVPEKSYRALDPAALLDSYRLNAVGPALVAKHMLPRMPAQGRAVFAALGARIGSIGDNRGGGWHSYRASKAALAMLIRNFAIETARRAPDTLCVGLHPGTVDTPLSRPFQRGVPAEALFTPAHAAAHLLAVIDGLQVAQTGRVLAWDGATIPE